MLNSRLNCILLEVFKSIKPGLKQSTPVYIQELLKVKRNNYNLRDSFLLLQTKKRTTNFGLRTFSYFGSKLWNDLENDLKNEIMNLEDAKPSDFKSVLKKWSGPNFDDISNFYV